MNYEDFEPVFIIGCPRSGTTFLANLLDANEETGTTPQSNFVNETLDKNSFNNDHTKIMNFIINHWRFKAWEITMEKEIDKNHSFENIIRYIVGNYMKKNYGEPKKYWIDHTPSNIKYVNKLAEIFPKAKFIHLIRDGRGIAASMLSLDWGANNTIYAAKIWKENILLGLAAEKLISKTQILTIRYEDVVNNTENELEKICNFLNLDFNPKMLQGGNFKLPAYTVHQHELVGKQVNSGRVTKWMKDLSNREISYFEKEAGTLLDYLGYSVANKNKRIFLFRLVKITLLIQHHLKDYLVNKRKEKQRIKKTVD